MEAMGRPRTFRRLDAAAVAVAATVGFVLPAVVAGGSTPLAALEAACSLTARSQPPPWEAGGELGGRRLWRASTDVRAPSIKARSGSALTSPLTFDFPKGSVVGQAGACELVDGLLRLQVFDPKQASGGASPAELPTGWVTLTAERKGGPRFFAEVTADEAGEASRGAGLAQCVADSATTGASVVAAGTVAVPLSGELAAASEAAGDRACSGEDPGPLCRAPRGPGGAAVVADLDARLWEGLVGSPHREELWLVATYTPWCDSCAEFLASWTELAAKCPSSRTRFAAVNCHANQELCEGLALPGHPLAAVRYGGDATGALAAVKSWDSRRDGAAKDWLPDDWSFVPRGLGAARALEPLLDALPPDFKLACGAAPALAARADEKEAAAVPEETTPERCSWAASASRVGGRRAEVEGPNVGADWPEEPAVGSKPVLRADALHALSESLDVGSGSFLGLRRLAALELWLNATVPLLPQAWGVSGLLAQLQGYAADELRRSLAAGGARATCAAEWANRAGPVKEALQAAAASSQGICKDRGCRLWSLLHGLAAAAAAPSPDAGNRPLARCSAPACQIPGALWALITAEVADDSVGPISDALGGREAAKALAEVIAKGSLGVAEAAAEDASSRANADGGLILWRLHAVATAREALRCARQGGPVPDLRWPPAAVCPRCWRRCFRQRRFCWEPWEDQRNALAAQVPEGFADALPNEPEVLSFLAQRYSWQGSTTAIS